MSGLHADENTKILDLIKNTIDFEVEDVADYLSVNCRENYEAIKKFGQLRFEQGQVAELMEVNKMNDTSVARHVKGRAASIRAAAKAQEITDKAQPS